MPRHLAAGRSLAVLLLSLGLVAASVATRPHRAAADDTCRDTVTAAYTVRVCLQQPVAGATVTGDVTLGAEVTFPVVNTSTLPTVERVVFTYRDEYLLTDNAAPFGMLWRSARLPNGLGTLLVRARLSDAVLADFPANLTLANNAPLLPSTEQFVVSRGTTPAPGQRFRLAAVGDGADGSPGEAAVAQLISGWGPHMFAYLGDVYERGSLFEFDNWYGTSSGFGQFRDITNPVIGNHEYLTPAAAGYFDYWDNAPHYYSFDVAGWHVVALDSNSDFGQLQPGTPQYDWLAADLGANRARCTLVYMHHPRFSVARVGSRRSLSQVWALLADRRVTLAVAGHAHQYEQWVPMDREGVPSPGGVTQLVAGAGGHGVSGPVFSDPRLAASAPALGALQLDLGTDDVAYNYIATDGAYLQGGTIGCTSTGDTLPPTAPAGLLANATSATTATLSWEASTDQYTSVAGYTVRRNGKVLAQLAPTATAYVDSGLAAGTTYSYTVDAFDPSSNYSPQSAAAAVTMPAAPAATVSSRVLLSQLSTAPERPRRYARSRFPTWTDADRDRCSTRAEVLLAEAVRPPTLSAACDLAGGRWFSRYDGTTTTRRSALGVDHLVPLTEAWASGAFRWAPRSRRALANDLGYAHTLTVATRSSIRDKAGREPRDWLPSRSVARCPYLAQWVAVKWRWHLSVDRAERRHLARRLTACGSPPVIRPARPPIARR